MSMPKPQQAPQAALVKHPAQPQANPHTRPPADSHQVALHQRIESSFVRQGLMRHLGARIVSVTPGEVEVALPYSERVTQQQGGYHGGAMGALADIAAGYAGLTRVPEGMEVTTVEYKINFLAAFKDGELRARGHVVRAGKRLIITTAEVVHLDTDGSESPCALMQQTLAVVKQTY